MLAKYDRIMNAKPALWDIQTQSDLFDELFSKVTYGSATGCVIDDEGMKLDIEIPGVDPASVSLSATANTITVTYQHRGKEQSKSHKVSDRFDVSLTKATYEHGVLSLFVPIASNKKAKKIDIVIKK